MSNGIGAPLLMVPPLTRPNTVPAFNDSSTWRPIDFGRCISDYYSTTWNLALGLYFLKKLKHNHILSIIGCFET